MNGRTVLFSVLAVLPYGEVASTKEPGAPPFVTVGLHFGSIEEGARIFGPVRLLPFEHPEAFGHDFPNPQQLRGTEFETLVLLGQRAGLELYWTLQRYPSQPDPTWPYPEFSQPPLEALRTAPTVRRPGNTAPVPGLRAVAFDHLFPVAFIVDTRGLTLAERGMTRVTTMGLDMSRAAFLEGLKAASVGIPPDGVTIVVYERAPCVCGPSENVVQRPGPAQAPEPHR